MELFPLTFFDFDAAAAADEDDLVKDLALPPVSLLMWFGGDIVEFSIYLTSASGKQSRIPPDSKNIDLLLFPENSDGQWCGTIFLARKFKRALCPTPELRLRADQRPCINAKFLALTQDWTVLPIDQISCNFGICAASFFPCLIELP